MSLLYRKGIVVPRYFWQMVFPWSKFRNGLVTVTFQLRQTFTHIWITAQSWLRLTQCWVAWGLLRTEKEKPAAGKTDYWRGFWRRRWDSNPRGAHRTKTISSRSRYDRFDTSPSFYFNMLFIISNLPLFGNSPFYESLFGKALPNHTLKGIDYWNELEEDSSCMEQAFSIFINNIELDNGRNVLILNIVKKGPQNISENIFSQTIWELGIRTAPSKPIKINLIVPPVLYFQQCLPESTLFNAAVQKADKNSHYSPCYKEIKWYNCL